MYGTMLSKLRILLVKSHNPEFWMASVLDSVWDRCGVDRTRIGKQIH